MPFTIVRQDLTKMKVDAIVNAANTALQMGGGVCGAVFKAAGASELQTACKKLAPIQTGDAVITPGFALPTKFVVHTAGPVYRGGKNGGDYIFALQPSHAARIMECVDNMLQSPWRNHFTKLDLSP
jgi:O-acetyl-ADP-ribose deacetylase (regulator of RNase III)